MGRLGHLGSRVPVCVACKQKGLWRQGAGRVEGAWIGRKERVRALDAEWKRRKIRSTTWWVG